MKQDDGSGSVRLSDYELGWIVGFLEGEGSFTFDRTQRMAVETTDEDAIETCASILTKIIGKRPYVAHNDKSHKDRWNDTYRCVVHGENARMVMRLVVHHMHKRRRGRIWQCLNGYKEQKIDLIKMLGLEKCDG